MRFISLLFLAFSIQNSSAQVQEFLNPIESRVLNVSIKNTEEENIKKKAIEIFENYKLNALKIDEPSSKQICELTKKVNEWTECKGSRENNTKTVKYTGEFKDGKHHGFGKEVLTNGTQFTGYYENNQRKYGLLNLPSSSIFVSYADAGKIEGNVLHLEKDGSLYVGGFSNSKKNGVGLLISSNNSAVMGNFVEGVLVENKVENVDSLIKSGVAVVDSLFKSSVATGNSEINTKKENINSTSIEEIKYFAIKDLNLGYKYAASRDKKNCKLDLEINGRSYYSCKSAETTILGKNWYVTTIYTNDVRSMVVLALKDWLREDLVKYSNELAKSISVRFDSEPVLKSTKVDTYNSYFDRKMKEWEARSNCTFEKVQGKDECDYRVAGGLKSEVEPAERICGACPALNTLLVWKNSVNYVVMESQIQEFKNSPIQPNLKVLYQSLEYQQVSTQDLKDAANRKITLQNEARNSKLIDLKNKKEKDKNDF